MKMKMVVSRVGKSRGRNRRRLESQPPSTDWHETGGQALLGCVVVLGLAWQAAAPTLRSRGGRSVP